MKGDVAFRRESLEDDLEMLVGAIKDLEKHGGEEAAINDLKGRLSRVTQALNQLGSPEKEKKSFFVR